MYGFTSVVELALDDALKPNISLNAVKARNWWLDKNNEARDWMLSALNIDAYLPTFQKKITNFLEENEEKFKQFEITRQNKYNAKKAIHR